MTQTERIAQLEAEQYRRDLVIDALVDLWADAFAEHPEHLPTVLLMHKYRDRDLQPGDTPEARRANFHVVSTRVATA